jgi:hypothetical protein
VSATAHASGTRGLTLASNDEPPKLVEAPKTVEVPNAVEAPKYVVKPALVNTTTQAPRPINPSPTSVSWRRRQRSRNASVNRPKPASSMSCIVTGSIGKRAPFVWARALSSSRARSGRSFKFLGRCEVVHIGISLWVYRLPAPAHGRQSCRHQATKFQEIVSSTG